MKILHICPGFFDRDFYNKLFLALNSHKAVNEVFTLSLNNINSYSGDSYRVKILNRKFNIFDRFFYFRKQYIIYKKICVEYPLNKFNAIHAHTLFSSGFSAYLIHKKFNLPYIVTVRNTDINVFFKYMFHLRIVGRAILKNSQNIIFLSPSYRDQILHKYFDIKDREKILNKSVVIPNGIDEYFLNNMFIGKKEVDVHNIRLIYIGEIKPNKNIETTIRACKWLQKKGYNVNYTIVGEIQNKKYNRIIGKNNFIRYHPKCSKEEVVTHLRSSDIFIMPSVLETFGLVYAEAMSQGLPVIYTRGQGFDGHFNDGVVGYAVDCFDYKGISDKIIDLYKNYQEFSERCIAFAGKFNWSEIAGSYLRMIDKHQDN